VCMRGETLNYTARAAAVPIRKGPSETGST
jgi:hypothetical protein